MAKQESKPNNNNKKLSKYDYYVRPHLAWINEQAKNGVIESEIAVGLGISLTSLRKYKRMYRELEEALENNKGQYVKQNLINSGIRAAIGYFEVNETETTTTSEKMGTTTTIVRTKVWYPPNPQLNKFYVMNLCKEDKWTSDPQELEVKKQAIGVEEANDRIVIVNDVKELPLEEEQSNNANE